MVIEDIIEAQISDYNHAPELAETIRNTVKEALKEFASDGYRTSITLSESCSAEDVETLNRLFKEMDEYGSEKMDKMLRVIVRLKIEMCEHMYFDERNKKRLRLV